MKLNANYQNLKKSYLFIDIARRVKAYTEANPNADIIRLGIGDVTRPLPAPVVATGDDCRSWCSITARWNICSMSDRAHSIPLPRWTPPS